MGQVAAYRVLGVWDRHARVLRRHLATSLLDLDSLYGIALPRERGFGTLAGFVLWQLGAIPKGGESFTYEGWSFTVLEMDRRRIVRVRVEGAQRDVPRDGILPDP